jgi:hypothetical protein
LPKVFVPAAFSLRGLMRCFGNLSLADTTSVVFPLGSFDAASLAGDTFRIVTWLPKRCFKNNIDLQ